MIKKLNRNWERFDRMQSEKIKIKILKKKRIKKLKRNWERFDRMQSEKIKRPLTLSRS